MNRTNRHLLAAFAAAVALAALLLPGGLAQTKPGKPNAVAQGKQLFRSYQCASCHSVGGVGGCMGPVLDGVTKHRTDAYLRLRLTNTKEDAFIALIKHPEIFPHPRFSATHVEQLLAYLKTLPQPVRPAAAAPVHKISPSLLHDPDTQLKGLQQPTASSREGRRLLLESGCMACHSIGQTGGSEGPAFDGIGLRHSRRYIEAFISDPYKLSNRPRSKRMPQHDLFPDQVKKITDYLLTLPK